MAEDEMVRKHHQLNGHEFEQTLGDSGGQRSLVCCSPRGHKEVDTTQKLNNNNTRHRGVGVGKDIYSYLRLNVLNIYYQIVAK